MLRSTYDRRALRFFVPLAQRAIALREETKSIGVMCSYQGCQMAIARFLD